MWRVGRGALVRRPQQVEEDGGRAISPFVQWLIEQLAWFFRAGYRCTGSEIALEAPAERALGVVARGGWLSPDVESFSKTKGVAGLIGFLACRATDCVGRPGLSSWPGMQRSASERRRNRGSRQQRPAAARVTETLPEDADGSGVTPRRGARRSANCRCRAVSIPAGKF